MRDRISVLGILLILGGIAWTMLVVSGTWYLGIRESAEYRCMVAYAGPPLADYEAAGISPEDSSVLHASFGLLPLGWRCRWTLGESVYDFGPGDVPTAFALIGATAVVAGAIVLVRTARRAARRARPPRGRSA